MDDISFLRAPTLNAMREAMVSGLTARLIGEGAIDEDDARAMLLGERIDLRSRFAGEVLARNPLTVPVKGGGVAVLFRYGAVVLFDVPAAAQAPFLDQVLALVWNR